MRLIDADALMKTLKISDDCEHCEQCEYDYFCSMGGAFVSACEAISEAPSIEIVRCKECKKANTKDCSHSYWDDDWGVWRIGYKGDDWFCADGEREDE